MDIPKNITIAQAQDMLCSCLQASWGRFQWPNECAHVYRLEKRIEALQARQHIKQIMSSLLEIDIAF